MGSSVRRYNVHHVWRVEEEHMLAKITNTVECAATIDSGGGNEGFYFRICTQG
jgi:hypothetical protein